MSARGSRHAGATQHPILAGLESVGQILNVSQHVLVRPVATGRPPRAWSAAGKMIATYRVMLPAVAAAVLGIAALALGPAVPILGRATVGAAAAASTSAAIARVALVIDGVTDASAKHGLDALRTALKDKGIEILEDAAQVETAALVIVAGVGSDPAPVSLLGPDSLTIPKPVHYQP